MDSPVGQHESVAPPGGTATVLHEGALGRRQETATARLVRRLRPGRFRLGVVPSFRA